MKYTDAINLNMQRCCGCILKGGGGSDRHAASVVSRSLTGHGAKDARMTRDDKLVLTPLKYFQDRVGRQGQTPAAEPGSAASVLQGALPHTGSSKHLSDALC